MTPTSHALLVAHIEQRPLHLAAHVPGDPVRRIAAVERTLVDGQPLGKIVELGPQGLRDEQLVEARPQLRHGPTLGAGCRSYHDRVVAARMPEPVSHRGRQAGEDRECVERSAGWLRNARWGAGRCGWHHDSMAEPVRNRRSTIDLDDEDVDGAIERMAGRDLDQGRDAEHVYDTLTWGEGPSRIDQAGVQRWLWYELPTKYMTDEPGYMTRLAAVAAEMFDELGLDAVRRALCRSQVTAGVHAALIAPAVTGSRPCARRTRRRGSTRPISTRSCGAR